METEYLMLLYKAENIRGGIKYGRKNFLPKILYFSDR